MSYYNEDGTLMCEDGTFMCQACLIDKSLTELSPQDARYCTFCQTVIEEEYRATAERLGRANQYKPVPPQKPILTTEIAAMPNCIDAGVKTKKSTLNENTATVDNFRPKGRQKTYKKRELPVELIEQLHSQDMGSKAIASTLKKRNIIVSYKTIQRILAGKRN